MKKIISVAATMIIAVSVAGCKAERSYERIDPDLEQTGAFYVEETDAFSAEEFGFLSEQDMGRWIEVNSISKINGYVEFKARGYEQYVREFKDNVMYLYDSYEVIPATRPSEVRAYEVLSNDSIEVSNNGKSYAITITERVVVGDMFIIKTIVKNSERWFVLEDMLDWDALECIDDPDDPENEYRKTYRYYFKTQG